MRLVIASLTLALTATAACAQQQQSKEADPTKAVQGAALPAGWSARLDDGATKRGMTAANLHFVTMGEGYHVTSGPAAIYYNPRDMMKGSYTVSATFTQEKAPSHPEAYGLFVGGSNLQDTTEQYFYFLVRGNGQYLVNHRAGMAVHKIVDWTPSPAVKAQDASGKATNALAIRVTPDSVVLVANGTPVRAFSRAEMHGMVPDGQAGIRVNHNLDVHVADFKAAQQ